MFEQANISWPGWETVRLIGRGSFGAVYEIQRDVFGEVEKAALKVISIPQNASDIDEMYSDGYDDESITSAFQSHLKSIVAEYSLMRKMNGSSNVVNCDDMRYTPHDDGIGWDIFIKMELLTPLTKALPADYSEETTLKIAQDLCAALNLCKRFDIVHRDIKPQNIFVSPLGDYKLGDFGIAKTVEKTMGGTKIGTYKYMAPEVYNNQPYGTASDIYSLGLVLYWLMNERRMPFMPMPPERLTVGMEERARMRRFSGEPLPPPANGSEKLKKIVLKACAFAPNNRFASPQEMLEALSGDNHTPAPHIIEKEVQPAAQTQIRQEINRPVRENVETAILHSPPEIRTDSQNTVNRQLDDRERPLKEKIETEMPRWQPDDQERILRDLAIQEMNRKDRERLLKEKSEKDMLPKKTEEEERLLREQEEQKERERKLQEQQEQAAWERNLHEQQKRGTGRHHSRISFPWL